MSGLISRHGLNKRPWFAVNGCSRVIYSHDTWPCAIRDPSTGRVWLGWEGWNGSVRNNYLRVLETDGTWTDQVLIPPVSLVNDAHGLPGIEFDSDGHAHMFGWGHDTVIKHAYSDSPNDPSAWTEGTNLPAGTYPKPVFVNGDMYVIYRGDSQNLGRSQKSTSISNGVITWAASRNLINFTSGVSRFYAGTVEANGNNIEIIACRSDAGDTERKHVYWFNWDTVADEIHSLDGTSTATTFPITSSSDPNFNAFRIFEHTSSPDNSGMTPCFCKDRSGNTHILYLDGLTSGSSFNIEHMIWDGSSLSSATTVGTGDYRYQDFTIVPWGNGVAAFWVHSTAWATRGGDLYRAIYDGSNWGAGEIILAGQLHALLGPSRVKNGNAKARIMVTECLQASANESGALRCYLYGENGFVQAPALIPETP